jgi:hypothetical protein
MATPGFTAEAGLASTGRRYRTARHASRATADSLLTPAASGFRQPEVLELNPYTCAAACAVVCAEVAEAPLCYIPCIYACIQI